MSEFVNIEEELSILSDDKKIAIIASLAHQQKEINIKMEKLSDKNKKLKRDIDQYQKTIAQLTSVNEMLMRSLETRSNHNTPEPPVEVSNLM